MGRFMDRIKTHIIFPRWYPQIARKMEKIVARDGQYFERLHCNRFFTIKPQISRKKLHELICTPINLFDVSFLLKLQAEKILIM